MESLHLLHSTTLQIVRSNSASIPKYHLQTKYDPAQNFPSAISSPPPHSQACASCTAVPRSAWRTNCNDTDSHVLSPYSLENNHDALAKAFYTLEHLPNPTPEIEVYRDPYYQDDVTDATNCSAPAP